MWFKTIFRRKAPRPNQPRPRRASADADAPLFDELFLRRMERLSLQAQRTLRGNPASGEHPSRHRMPASIFSDHRPYSSGDDLRYLDWNAYARQEHLLLKLGEAEQDVHVHLLLDASRSMTIGSASRARLAAQLAGAIGYLTLAHSDRLRIVPFGPTGMRPFGPVQGKAFTVPMLQYLSDLQPQPETHLATVIARHAIQHPQGGIVLLISDLLARDHLAEALRPLAPPRWQTVVVHLIDRRDLQPELAGPLELVDSESGATLSLTLDDDTLTAYRQAVAHWRSDLARQCAVRGATYAPVMSDWPLERQVLPYLRARRLLS
ncbi:MAG: DUF58 domain-containing protein [Oscillochloris sp.]|nr:DUF58 domain-containing protein [Oscillochloris sp.]